MEKMSEMEKEARAKLGMEDGESTVGKGKTLKEVGASIRNAGENESEGDDDAGPIEGDTTGPIVPEPGKKPDAAIKSKPSDYTKRN